MANPPVNATGWSELIDGNMVGAVYNMFDSAFGAMGLIVVMLFFTYQIMLYAKTENITLIWIMSVIFVSLYATSTFVEPFAVPILFMLLIFELAGVLYLFIFAK